MERDLVFELGRANFYDQVAGEALLLGELLNEPRLIERADRLAVMIREIPYNHDRFALVIAEAESLAAYMSGGHKTIEQRWEAGSRKTRYDWRYELSKEGSRYRISLDLDVIDGTNLQSKCKSDVVAVLMSHLGCEGLEEYQMEVMPVEYESQTVVYERYYREGRLEVEIVNHEHEGRTHRGRRESYFFESLTEALEAWEEIKNPLEKV